MNEAKKIISALNLIPHPEGGYYKEVYRSVISFQAENEEVRNLTTSIFFLLEKNQISAFHRLKSDELWYYHSGSALTVYFINKDHSLTSHLFGCEIDKGELPQLIITAGTIFGAEVNEKNSFSLFGCVVSPGFDFKDFDLTSREYLLKNYPQHKEIIHKLTY